MPLRSFTIKNHKAIQHAKSGAVPPLMIISGPNGVGKSTLLYALKSRTGQVDMDGKVLYLSAHRIWRRQTLPVTQLWGENRRFSDILSQDSVSSFGGIRILEGARTPDSADESFSVVKYTLAQFEIKKQNAVNALLERTGRVDKDEIGDVYQPLRDFTKYLLPHLSFARIDLSNRNSTNVFFTRTDKAGSYEVELDNLSSGERSLVALFLPFLERQIEEGVKRIEDGGVATTGAAEDTIVLLDEPEIHLHPLLQTQLIEYLRTLTKTGKIQFVLTTHSPTIVDAADHTELFVLRPPTGTPDDNQLVQVADTTERLSAIRDLTGNTYTLTSGKNLLCIEGELPSADNNKHTDVRILELICPEISAFIVMPFGGKTETLKAAQRLKELLPSSLGLGEVYALVDRDSDETKGEEGDGVHRLPVAMIENFLLNPAAIWDLVMPHKEIVGLRGVDHVRASLVEIAQSMKEDEVRIRIQRSLRPSKIQPEGTSLEDVRKHILAEADTLISRLPSEEDFTAIVANAEKAVAEVMSTGQELRLFRGKEILKRFHAAYVNKTGIGFAPFCLQLARIIGENETYREAVVQDLAIINPKPL